MTWFEKEDRSFIALAFAIWFLPSPGILAKFIGVPMSLLASVIALVGIAAVFPWMRRRAASAQWNFDGRHFAAAWLAAAIALAVVAPLSHSGLFGVGSDREDALAQGISAILNGRYPYSARTYLGFPISVLPGSFLLAAPFYLVGYAGLQNLFWFALFLRFLIARLGKDLASAFYVLTFFFLAPAPFRDFAVGGDYTTNAMLVAVAAGAVLWATDRNSPWYVDVAAAIFLGIAICTRPVYVVAVPPIAAYIVGRQGFRQAALVSALAVATALVLALPFLLHDPGTFTPLGVARKLAAIPHFLMPAVTLPILALGVSCIGFFRRLDQAAMYGLIATSLSVFFLPEMVFTLLRHGWRQHPLLEFEFFGAASLFAGIWLMMRFVESTAKQPDPR